MKNHIGLFLVTAAIIVGSNVYTGISAPRLLPVLVNHRPHFMRRYDDGVRLNHEAVLTRNVTVGTTSNYSHRRWFRPLGWLLRR